MSAVRICPRCSQRRALDDFAVDRHKSSGRKSWCKRCDRERSRAYYREHAAQVIARVQARRRLLEETLPLVPLADVQPTPGTRTTNDLSECSRTRDGLTRPRTQRTTT
jgi:hypothetical protein